MNGCGWKDGSSSCASEGELPPPPPSETLFAPRCEVDVMVLSEVVEATDAVRERWPDAGWGGCLDLRL